MDKNDVIYMNTSLPEDSAYETQDPELSDMDLHLDPSYVLPICASKTDTTTVTVEVHEPKLVEERYIVEGFSDEQDVAVEQTSTPLLHDINARSRAPWCDSSMHSVHNALTDGLLFADDPADDIEIVL
ncbi:tyrosine- kinase Mer isoform X1 [Pelobates cultripes]|nr:tyrosine- kinase Mer isoform X1 [Pelobates cultripes]CAH2253118.1 tyrosine- kinase Mer isoform X1 [Pelobates cultripes]